MAHARPPNTTPDHDSTPENFWFEGREYQRYFDPDAGAWRTREIGAGYPDAWQIETPDESYSGQAFLIT